MASHSGRRQRFALIGVAGFVATRHLAAIKEIGGTLVAGHDINDSVGVLDSYFPQTRFFLDRAEFSAYLSQPDHRVDYIVICTPTDLHEQDCLRALEVGANVIVEKPPVLDPGGISRLAEQEQATGRTVHPVLQLRYHPAIERLRQAEAGRPPAARREVEAYYVSRRGPWYQTSWKGDPDRSGTIIFNFGIHLFDALSWIYGPSVGPVEARINGPGTRAEGILRLSHATVRWMLSTREDDLPDGGGELTAWRQLLVDGEPVVDFSENYAGLHHRVYQEVIAGRGYRIRDARDGTVLAHESTLAALSRSATPGRV